MLLTRRCHAQVRYWHEYHFGVAPKEFLRETKKEDLVRSKTMQYRYKWMVAEQRLKRSIAAAS